VRGLRRDAQDRLVEQWLVRHHAARLDAARRRQHELRLRVLDALRQLRRREAAEHHRVDGADARAGEHREDGLGDHRHVEEHAVAARDAGCGERTGDARDLLLELRIREAPRCAGDGALVEERCAFAVTRGDVAVHCVVAGVERRPREPGRAQRIACQRTARRRVPVDRRGFAQPEGVGVGEGRALELRQSSLHEAGGVARPRAAVQRATASSKRCASAPRLPRRSAA